MKQAKSLTREQYLKKFNRAVRWRLPPQESEEAIADYRELVLEEERDESKLVEELGEPVQAAHLLTDVRTYRRWLAVFAVLSVGLFLLAKWAWMWYSSIYFSFAEQWWYPVWVMAVELPLFLIWFHRNGQKSGSMPKWLLPALLVVLVFGVGTMTWNWHIFSQIFLERYAEVYPHTIPWHIALQRELIIEGGVVCSLLAFAGLILAKCYDRRWLALYVLALTVSVSCCFVGFFCRGTDLGAVIRSTPQTYLFTRLIPIGAVGLIGTGVALC